MSRLFGNKNEVKQPEGNYEREIEEIEEVARRPQGRPRSPPQDLPELPKKQEKVQIREVEITLSLLNEKLNYIIQRIEEGMAE